MPSRVASPVCRRCRALGEKLYLKGEKCLTPKCPFTRRSYRPGEQGQKRSRRRQSEFSRHLIAKQKVRAKFGLSESQLKVCYLRARRSSEMTGLKLILLLETRLDNVLYRLGLAASRRWARQMIAHGQVSVNGKKVVSPSFLVQPGQTIESKTAKRADLRREKPPAWLELKGESLALVSRWPEREEMEKVDERLIVEYYSR